ncbi:MAG: hypothetical protein ACRD2J_16270 [Thermoanaerobaculia bacterium]
MGRSDTSFNRGLRGKKVLLMGLFCAFAAGRLTGETFNVDFGQQTFNCASRSYVLGDPAAGGVLVRFSVGAISSSYWHPQASFLASYRCSGFKNHVLTITFSKPAKNIRFRFITYERTEINGVSFASGEHAVVVPGPTSTVTFVGFGPKSSFWGWEFVVNSFEFELAEAQPTLFIPDVFAGPTKLLLHDYGSFGYPGIQQSAEEEDVPSLVEK